MIDKELNSIDLYYAIISGAEKIIVSKALLNEANGFPVPDRDTGSNLAFLMSEISKRIVRTNNFSELMMSLSNAAVIGARGNSGSIFSQFFIGFGIDSENHEVLNVSNFANFFNNGFDYAYKSIKNPVEGTILSAMRSFSIELSNQAKIGMTIKDAFKTSLESLTRTVKQSKYVLKRYTQGKYEDAGALAFLLFMDGFIGSLLSDNLKVSTLIQSEDINNLDGKTVIHNIDIEIKNRYCTEVLIERNGLNINDFETHFEFLGDSLVINGNEKYLKVHIHTNFPHLFTKKMSEFGKILEVKADDMIMQRTLTRDHKNKIAIVIDSIADVPIDEHTDFVFQLPLNLIVDNVTYQDKRTIFKELLNSKNVTSSQLNNNQIMQFIMPILKRFEHVIILTVSSKMSGLYERYEQIVKDYPNKTTLIDSKSNSVGEGLIVFETIRLLKKNINLETLLFRIKDYIEKTKIYVSLPDLKSMIKSGRLNERIGFVLQKFGYLPLVTINSKGEGTVKGLCFSKKSNEKLLISIIENNKEIIENYAISHVYDRDKAEELSKMLESIIGFRALYIEEVSSIVANFSGEGSVAVAFTTKER